MQLYPSNYLYMSREVFPSTWAQSIQAVVLAVRLSGAFWLTHRETGQVFWCLNLTKLQPYDNVYDMLESLFFCKEAKLSPKHIAH